MNPNTLVWPTDPTGVTADFKKQGVLAAQRLYDADQLKIFLGCLDVLKEYATAACNDRQELVKARVAAAAASAERAAALAAEQELSLAQARLKALGDVEVAQAAVEEAKAAVNTATPKKPSTKKG